MNELFRRLLFLPPQASTIAREIDTLHYVVISVTMVGATAVAAAAAYFILRYRRTAGRASLGLDQDSRHLAGGIPHWVEIGLIVFLLALFFAFWLVGYRQFVRLEIPPKGTIDIYVSAKQWMWSFAYPEGAMSNGVLYVPTNRPVKLILSARDVIHSFFVPHFRVKKDVLPGQVTVLWFEAVAPGVYPVFCTEYCGLQHSTMRAEIVALPEPEYAARLEQLDRLRTGAPQALERTQGVLDAPGATSLARLGERIAVMQGCMRCHTPDGTPHIGPTWAGVYGRQISLQDGSRVLADEAYLTESMMDPLAKLRLGFETVMPSYQGLLSAPETSAVVEYIRSLSTLPAGARTAPLAPAGSPRVALPSASGAPP